MVSTSDTNAPNSSYQWDAEQRLTGVIQGTNQSQFYYDGMGRRLRIVETSGGVTVADRRFVWCGSRICEEWNSNNVVVNRYFAQGEQQGGTNLFYARDHLGSIRELTDNTATDRAEYAFSPFGSMAKLDGNAEASFGFTGHFRHLPSGLNLTLYRAYDAGKARWLSRDPIAEESGFNLYGYVLNNPVNTIDPLGLCPPRKCDHYMNVVAPWGIAVTGGYGLGGTFSVQQVLDSQGNTGFAVSLGGGFFGGASGSVMYSPGFYRAFSTGTISDLSGWSVQSGASGGELGVAGADATRRYNVRWHYPECGSGRGPSCRGSRIWRKYRGLREIQHRQLSVAKTFGLGFQPFGTHVRYQKRL